MKLEDKKLCFVDFETAKKTKDFCGICAYGIIELSYGIKHETIKDYVNPEIEDNEWDIVSQRKHKIYPCNVIGKPNFKEVWDTVISKYFDGTYIVVAHNTQGSEIDDIIKNSKRYSFAIPQVILFYDTQILAKNHGDPERLEDLAKLYNVRLDNPHDPGDDANACLELFLKYNEMGIIDDKPIHYDTIKRKNNLRKSSDSFWNGTGNRTKYKYRKKKDFPKELIGKKVCISGLFKIGEKELEEFLRRNGCVIKDISSGTTKCNTELLVVGDPNPQWKGGIGRKTEAYERFVKQGYKVDRITQDELYELCGIELYE